MHGRTSWLAALLAGLLATVAPGAPAAATDAPRMIDLGAGGARIVNGRGDILGTDVNGAYLVWNHRDYRPAYLGVSITDWSGGADLNERGDVVMREFYWHDGTLAALAHPDGGIVINAAINDRGVIAGTRYADGARTAFTYRNGIFTEFPGLPGTTGTTALGINNRGQVLIDAINETGTTTSARFPLLWSGRQVTRIGDPDSTWTVGQLINESGMVVGSTVDVAGGHLFRWQDGVMTTLGGTGGATIYGMNARGDVAGRLGMTAVLWRAGVPIMLTPGRDSSAYAVNDRGEVAGNLTGPAVPWASFRWRDGTATFYTSPRQTGYADAVGVDLRGRLVTNIYLDQQDYHAVVWIDRRHWSGGQPGSGPMALPAR